MHVAFGNATQSGHWFIFRAKVADAKYRRESSISTPPEDFKMKMYKISLRQNATPERRRRLRLTCIFAAALIIAALLSACGGEEMPGTGTGSGAGTQSETAAESESEADPTSTIQVQDTSRTSLDEYMAFCGGPESEAVDFEENFSLKELSVALGDFTKQLEAVEPPEEVADWHDAVLAYQRAIKESLDDYAGVGEGQSEDEYLLTTVFPLAFEYQPAIDAAISGMDADVYDRMVAADCIDDEFTGGSAPQIDAAVLTVGESVEVVLDSGDEGDTYSFQAEQGERYIIEVVRGTLPDFTVTLPVPGGMFPSNFIIADGREELSLRWEARTSGAHSFLVFGDSVGDVGSYTVSVWPDPSPRGPSNVRVDWDGTSIQVSWDPVDGAEHYNIYHHDLFETGCSVDRDGSTSFCDELAGNIVGTTYVHANPDDRDNFYWVVACNSEGCSDTAYNAAMPPSRPPEPSNVRYEGEASAVRVSWDLVDGADYYNVYYGNVQRCSGGAFSDCVELASDVAGTNYVHGDPHRDMNYYWVSACNASGCSDESSAGFVGGTPASPTNLSYEREGVRAILTWGPSEGATHYKVYFDDRGDSLCSISPQTGLPSWCDDLDDNVTQTSYVHTGAGSTTNYWVVACNRGGCSEIDSENPVKPIETRPTEPTNVRYAIEGSAIRVTWEAVPGADYYAIYYSDSFSSACDLDSYGRPAFCDELTTNVIETAYLHTEPEDDRNYYWVVACNRGGCSEILSERPAQASP